MRCCSKSLATALTCASLVLIARGGFESAALAENNLQIGAATISITPDRPVALWGQMHTRIAHQVESPCVATALALEDRVENAAGEQAILVACDLVVIGEGILPRVRERLAKRLKGFDVKKLIVSATHTHTGPVSNEGIYDIPREGVMQPTEYAEFLVERLSDVAAQAWESRKPGSVGWGYSHAVVANNRRAVYADGTAAMYGKTNQPNFRGIEGYEDHGVDVLCFWDKQDKLLATAINVACPAQEVEGRSAVNADFWHQVRESLQAKYERELHVLPWTGAAGDQSPHLMFRQRAEERMQKLRKLDRLGEIARRIVHAWGEAYEGARQEKHRSVKFSHFVEQIELPPRIVSERDMQLAQAKAEQFAADPRTRFQAGWHGKVVERYRRQQAGHVDKYPMELHVLRLGDVAIATNDFELYTDFGILMKARSPALQTFVIQLAGPGTYLPSERAVRGGGYSAIPESNAVGPEAGQVLVDSTVKALNSLWPDGK